MFLLKLKERAAEVLAALSDFMPDDRAAAPAAFLSACDTLVQMAKAAIEAADERARTLARMEEALQSDLIDLYGFD